MTGLAYRHPRAQRLRRLVERRTARKEEGRFVIEGLNLLEEALDAEAPIEAVYLDGEWASGARADDVQARGHGRGGAGSSGLHEPAADWRLSGLVDRCLQRGARVFELAPGVLARVADTVTPQPVMAIVETPTFQLADVRALAPQLVVVCADVRDPGNAGSVARSAWAAGADAVVFCDGSVDPWSPKTVRASAGAVLHLPIASAGRPRAVLREIGEWGLRRLGAVRDGGVDYAAMDLTLPSALVFGNEASGLPVDELGPGLDGCVTIPMPGGAESLNVGMAAAVLCFEAARQRRYGPPGRGSASHLSAEAGQNER